ncbi:class I adenylate-forming enzyme family protein [Dactylosporangium sp. NPDC005572]|uniref:class I adenylate-forming enzyme family protein n=1 Tax=Dactylosporangium sp. NPDC005572 TaxID=3156889 RepID=UPI0033AC7438
MYANLGFALLTAQARRAPDAVAVTHQGHGYTYDELDRRVNRRANALAAAGVAPGTRVASLLGDPLAITELYLAQAKLGAVLVALNPYWTDDVLVAVVESSGSPVVLYDAVSAPVIERIRDRLSGVRTWLRAEELSSDSDAPPPIGASGDDVFALFFTSGTTGLPKPVTYTHSIALAAANLWTDVPRPAGSAFGTGPIIWGVGFVAIACPALLGGVRLVLESDFGPAGFLATVPRERITHVSVIPSFFAQLLSTDAHEGVDLDSIRIIMLGAEPLPRPLLERIRTRLPNALIYSYYGQTEAPYSCWARQDDGSVPLSSSGRARTLGAARVVDAEGRRLVGEVGEIQLSGPHVMAGYDGLPDATAAALRDGWFVGGDVGVMDETGVLTVLGRREDAIRKKGALTLPSTIEDAVLAMPGVAEAGVVGVPEHGEQKVLVAVVPRQGVELTPEAVTAHLTSLPPAAWPDLVVIADELPHANDASGGRGKLLRREIRTRWGGPLSP